jgi:hypothetical protein
MKIAVLGAPGAGKTAFARELVGLLSKDDFDRFFLIDDYMRDLRLRTGLEYAGYGSHVDDLQVVFKRREWELAWKRNNTVTVGTVLDSTVHCFVRTDEAARNRREVGLQAERLRTIAGTFGLLYTDTWDYDYAFLLRYKGDDWHSRQIDAGLVDLVATYAAPVLSFKTEVPDDEKASTAFRSIHALEAKQLPASSESGVRPGGEASEDDGNPAESVPDVPEQGRASDDS